MKIFEWKTATLIQKILAMISITAGVSCIIALIYDEYISFQTIYLHHFYGVYDPNLYYPFYKLLKTFGFYGGYVGIIAILIGKKDNFYKWLGVAGIAISFIGSVYYWNFSGGSLTYMDKIGGNEFSRYTMSLRIYACKTSSDQELRNEFIQDILKAIPYHPESYKGNDLYDVYDKNLPSLSFEEQRLIITEMDEWWRVNKNYLIHKSPRFIMDTEAKAARIWTDEYRKAHPWPKDETPH
jgi:hypothetical protein